MGNFITQIHINKVKHLHDLIIDIADNEKKHLIITGKNGSGKTTLLERIEEYLECIQQGYLTGAPPQLKERLENYNYSHNELLEIKNQDLYKQLKLGLLKKPVEDLTNQINKFTRGIEVVFSANNTIIEKYRDNEFILAYFSATRNVKIDIPTNVPKIQLKDKYDIQENIGRMFLNYLVYLKTQQSFARNEEDMEEVNKIQAWFDRFERALRKLFEDESIQLKFNYRELNFKIIQENREDYGFDELSDGYSAVLDIVINLILRMENHHKEAYDVEGIVLIDELENHLHIGLQKKILPFLTEFFPNVQFIVSTHSPFIINSIDNVVIYDLEKKQAVEDLSGIAYEGIVEGYFDVNQYSEKIKRKLERYNFLVERQDKNEDEIDEEYELRRYLKTLSPELAPEVVLAFNNIELLRKNKLRNNK